MSTTLHLSVLNDAASHELLKVAARNYVGGATNQAEYIKAVRAVCNLQAQKERQEFGSTFTGKELKECAEEVAGSMKRHILESISVARRADLPVTVNVRRWFDKGNGNSYWSALVYIPGATCAVYLPTSYGYGDQPERDIPVELVSLGVLPAQGVEYVFTDHGYGLKRDL